MGLAMVMIVGDTGCVSLELGLFYAHQILRAAKVDDEHPGSAMPWRPPDGNSEDYQVPVDCASPKFCLLDILQ